MPFVATAGRGLGVAAGAVNSVAWAFAMWVPTGGLTLTGVGLVVGFVMCLTSVVGVIAAVRGHAGMLLGAFLVSFLPVGAFVLWLEHWLYWTGWSDLALLAAAVMIRLGRGRERAVAAYGEHG